MASIVSPPRSSQTPVANRSRTHLHPNPTNDFPGMMQVCPASHCSINAKGPRMPRVSRLDAMLPILNPCTKIPRLTGRLKQFIGPENGASGVGLGAGSGVSRGHPLVKLGQGS